jgi:hypothetical protein
MSSEYGSIYSSIAEVENKALLAFINEHDTPIGLQFFTAKGLIGSKSIGKVWENLVFQKKFTEMT